MGGWLSPAPPPAPPSDFQIMMMKGPDVELMISPSDECPIFNELNFTTATPTPAPGQRCPVNVLNQRALTDFATNQTMWWEVFAEAWKVRHASITDKSCSGAPADDRAIQSSCQLRLLAWSLQLTRCTVMCAPAVHLPRHCLVPLHRACLPQVMTEFTYTDLKEVLPG